MTSIHYLNNQIHFMNILESFSSYIIKTQGYLHF